MKFIKFILIIFVAVSCSQDKNTLFTLVDESESNIDFQNTLEFDKDFNIYTYRNFYNGGGVAIGDINNDGLNDIYFTANMQPNKLYINQGNWKFKEVAEEYGVAGTKAWSTGVSLVDINSDGWLDIYVCNSGDVNGDDKHNELFINNQDGTFSERAEEYGLADQGFSTHAAFFDYDRDGDLDCYLLNNSYRSIGSFNLQRNERTVRDSLGGDKLFRNDNGMFTDVSEEAGIYGSEIGFGLGVTVGDVNMDGWMDLFISNDFFERDYLYINNGDGTFTEDVTQWMNSLSATSMGAEMVDVNNDLFPDIFVTDMLPETNERLKSKTTFENWDKYQFNLRHGYYHQFTRNMLQLNTRDSSFMEIGRQAGVEATDWSWAPLGADFDLDGRKEIFVANGIYRDLTDQDFIMFASSEEALKMVRRGHKEDFEKLIEIIPSVKISNYLFKWGKDYQYKNVAKEWGLGQPGFSNGSAYGDLDNDGDLDLVVNNVNMPCFVYRNNTTESHGRKSISIQLRGEGKNIFAYGAKVLVYGDMPQLIENIPIRGFQSTVANQIILPKQVIKGNGEIWIQWPDGRFSNHFLDTLRNDTTLRMADVDTFFDKRPRLSEDDRDNLASKLKSRKVEFENIIHRENEYSDFDDNRLLYQMYSRQGPRIAVADLNKDGLDDFYLCGAKGSPGQLYIQQANGDFQKIAAPAFESDLESEDVDAVFFDLENDGDLDLYVVSGGSEFSAQSSHLIDRLYINEGMEFTKSPDIYPDKTKFEMGSCVAAGDINGDGFTDLFVGTKMVPGHYGLPPQSYLLLNNGKGGLEAQDIELLKNPGMISDARFGDLDGDGTPELVVAGDYMSVMAFKYTNGTMKPYPVNNELKGWWSTLELYDIDGDGDLDICLGNYGLNSRFRASQERPVELFINDFDKNRSVEPILTAWNGVNSYPFTLRHDLIKQLPYLQRKFLKYENYKNAAISDIFTEEQLNSSVVLSANEMRSGVLINNGDQFTFEPFSPLLQSSCINAIAFFDQYMFVGGNIHAVKPEVGRLDASKGFVFEETNFQNVDLKDVLNIEGVVQDIKILRTNKGHLILFARNNESLVGYEL